MADPTDIHVNRNSITGYTGSSSTVQNDVPEELDAECNWWGSALGPGAPASTTSANVDFTPWLVSSNLSGVCSSDTTDPVVTVTAPATVNATSPAGATVNYTVSVTDDDPNVGAASCLPTSGSTFPVGATTITCTATDRSGNTGTGTATVTVVVTSNFLCTLTKQYIQGSAKYQGSSAFRKGAVNLLTSAACKFLTSIGPHFSPSHKAAFISAYKHYVSGLVPGGWLTSSQATTLRNLADAL